MSSGTKTRRGTLLKIEEIIEAVMSEHQGLVLDTNWGERGLFCNSDRSLPKGTYLMTFKERDEESDSASRIGRDGVYRLNLGIPKANFHRPFRLCPEQMRRRQDDQRDLELLRRSMRSPQPCLQGDGLDHRPETE